MTFRTVNTISAPATEKLAADAIAHEPPRWPIFAVLICRISPQNLAYGKSIRGSVSVALCERGAER
jgi:hypothetical protein